MSKRTQSLQENAKMMNCMCDKGKRFNKALQDKRRYENKVEIEICDFNNTHHDWKVRLMARLMQQKRRQGQHQGMLSSARVQDGKGGIHRNRKCNSLSFVQTSLWPLICPEKLKRVHIVGSVLPFFKLLGRSLSIWSLLKKYFWRCGEQIWRWWRGKWKQKWEKRERGEEWGSYCKWLPTWLWPALVCWTGF